MFIKCFQCQCFIEQAETMVAEWREFLWDIPEERVALWKHCHELFVRHSLPSLQVLFYVCMFVKKSLTLFSWPHDLILYLSEAVFGSSDLGDL
jgi:hypothetical protein